MTTDTTALQERIRRALSIPAEWARRRDGETAMEQSERWRKRRDEQIAALIAAEVRKAQDEGWEECAAMAAHHGDFDGSRTRWLSSINPYSIIEKENA